MYHPFICHHVINSSFPPPTSTNHKWGIISTHANCIMFVDLDLMMSMLWKAKNRSSTTTIARRAAEEQCTLLSLHLLWASSLLEATLSLYSLLNTEHRDCDIQAPDHRPWTCWCWHEQGGQEEGELGECARFYNYAVIIFFSSFIQPVLFCIV